MHLVYAENLFFLIITLEYDL